MAHFCWRFVCLCSEVSSTFEVATVERNNFAHAWHLQRNGFWLTSARTICALRPQHHHRHRRHPATLWSVRSLSCRQGAAVCVVVDKVTPEGKSAAASTHIFTGSNILQPQLEPWRNNRKAPPFEWLPQIDERNILRRREAVNYMNNEDVVHSKCERSSCVVLSLAWQTARRCCSPAKIVYSFFFSPPPRFSRFPKIFLNR